MTNDNALFLLTCPSFDRNDAFLIFKFLSDKVNSKKISDKTVDLLNLFYDKCVQANFFSNEDMLFLNVLMARGYYNSRFFWRGKKYAFLFLEIILDLDYNNYSYVERDVISDYLYFIGMLFMRVRDYHSALIIYELLEKWSIEDDGRSLYFQVINHIKLEDDFINLLSFDYIKNKYIGYSDKIINIIENKENILIDSVENSKQFHDIYDEIHEEVYLNNELDDKIDLKNKLIESFRQRGINWKMYDYVSYDFKLN